MIGTDRGKRLVLLLVVGPLCWVTAEAESSLAEVFEAARRVQQATPAFAFDVESLDYISTDIDEVPAHPAQMARYSVRSTGDLYEALGTTYFADADHALIPNYEARKYWDGEQSWGWSRPAGTPNLNFVVKAQEESLKRLWFDQDCGYFLEGRFPHNFDGDWTQILESERNIQLAPKLESVNGYPCHVIRADTGHGSYSLWIDPAHGFGIRKAEIIVEHDDTAWEARLIDSPYTEPG